MLTPFVLRALLFRHIVAPVDNVIPAQAYPLGIIIHLRGTIHISVTMW